MTRALRRNYLHMPNRLEVIVVAGINNVGAKDSAEDIINDMKKLKLELKEHSDKWRHNPPSYMSFSTIKCAPKLCSLTVPPVLQNLGLLLGSPHLALPTGIR